MTSPPDDEALIARAGNGDESAFAELVERYSDRIYTLVSSMVRDRSEAEDVVQEVFFKVYRKLEGFEGKSSFYTWLYRVSLNAATDHLKKRRNDRARSAEDFVLNEVPQPGAAPGRRMDRGELRLKMAEAIASLPPKYRDILVLREYQDCSYEEIAQVLGCSKGTVESRLFRARARLRDRLAPYLSLES
ncbi:MAG: RNA polymerase sigma factor [Planctomycetes bacterium]|nr:RNA polymerase sigma factor [Planctomycetota bacterium]